MPKFAAEPAVSGRVVLRAHGLRKSFGGKSVLNGVDLALHEGEVVLLRGENGSGKTTLLNILTGNLEPDAGTIEYLTDGTPRTCRFPRSWIGNLNPFDHFTPEFVAREGLGRTWQDVRLFGSHSLRDNIAVADSRNPGENPLIALFAPGRANHREAEICEQADIMLAQLGLAGREHSSGDMISLGQSKRVAIARAVAGGARILFLDEPLAGLDRQGIADILQLLDRLVKEQRLTLVIVEHVFNFTYLHHLVNVHWAIAEGRIVREIATPIPQEDSVVGIPVVTRPHWFHHFSQFADVLPPEKLPRGAVLTRIRLRSRYEPKVVFDVRGLVVRRGRRAIIGADSEGNETGFNLTLHEGEIAVLQAPNGWGKSTLLGALAGIVASASGSVTVGGREVSSMPDWKRVENGIHFNSFGGPYFSNLLVSEVIKLACMSTVDREHLGDVTQLERRVGSLSGGQSRKLSLSTFLKRSNLRSALLDEPLNALDFARCCEVVSSIIEAQAGCVLIAEPLR